MLGFDDVVRFREVFSDFFLEDNYDFLCKLKFNVL